MTNDRNSISTFVIFVFMNVEMPFFANIKNQVKYLVPVIGYWYWRTHSKTHHL